MNHKLQGDFNLKQYGVAQLSKETQKTELGRKVVHATKAHAHLRTRTHTNTK
jgi:hypothetical protein